MTTRVRQSRYINEAVGSFVLIAILIFIGAILLAGRAQGWLEGSIQVDVVFFDAEGLPSEDQGSFGLQEGDEVRIRSTKAGRVRSIEPTEDGGLKARLEIKERFHQYVRTDSVVLVKKKFGLAGDAYIEINGGKGAQVQSQSTLSCYKDEELMEIAQQTLANLQQAVVPMVVETTGVISNANRISAQISGGSGLVGAVINDPTLADGFRTSVSRLNELLDGAGETMHETTRLIKGAQNHWLLRKYMPEKKESIYLSPLFAVYGSTDNDLEKRCDKELTQARISALQGELSRAAANLALYKYISGYSDAAAILLQESDLSSDGDRIAQIHSSAAKLAIITNGPSCADDLLGMLEAGIPDDMKDAEYSEFLAFAVWKLADIRHPDAMKILQKNRKFIARKGSDLANAGIWAAEAALTSEPQRAGAYRDNESACLAKSGLFRAMAMALGKAGSEYEAANLNDLAASRYLSSSKSLMAQGYTDTGSVMLRRAEAAVKASGNEKLRQHIQSFSAYFSKEASE